MHSLPHFCSCADANEQCVAKDTGHCASGWRAQSEVCCTRCAPALQGTWIRAAALCGCSVSSRDLSRDSMHEIRGNADCALHAHHLHVLQ